MGGGGTLLVGAVQGVVEDGRDGPAAEGAAESVVGVGVEVCKHGSDAEPNGAHLVGLMGVQSERRSLSERGVHLVKPDLVSRASQ